jgi:hypothetical protein
MTMAGASRPSAAKSATAQSTGKRTCMTSAGSDRRREFWMKNVGLPDGPAGLVGAAGSESAHRL